MITQKPKQPLKTQSAFTILELLVVIVVIAILAAIAIIAYNGIQNKAEESKLQSDLRVASNSAEVECSVGGTCATSESDINDKQGFKPSPGTKLQYSSEAKDFCITASSTIRNVKAFHFNAASVPSKKAPATATPLLKL